MDNNSWTEASKFLSKWENILHVFPVLCKNVPCFYIKPNRNATSSLPVSSSQPLPNDCHRQKSPGSTREEKHSWLQTSFAFTVNGYFFFFLSSWNGHPWGFGEGVAFVTRTQTAAAAHTQSGQQVGDKSFCSSNLYKVIMDILARPYLDFPTPVSPPPPPPSPGPTVVI